MMTKRLSQIFFVAILLSIIVYLLLQFFVFSEPTSLHLNDYPAQTDQNSIILSGQAWQAKRFFIAGREILLDPNFGFQEEIFLFPGVNLINLKIENKSGKIKQEDIQILRTKND